MKLVVKEFPFWPFWHVSYSVYKKNIRFLSLWPTGWCGENVFKSDVFMNPDYEDTFPGLRGPEIARVEHLGLNFVIAC